MSDQEIQQPELTPEPTRLASVNPGVAIPSNITTANNTQKLFFIAGEASGDLHGANLIKALKLKNPKLETMGLGGPKMQAAGCDVLTDMMSLAVVGIVEVIKHFSQFKKLFHETLKTIEKERPDAVILIDYPGFNLRIAEKLKQLGIKVIYYISPQVWAWHKSRIKKMTQVIDQLIVILPFEKDFFINEGLLQVDFFGHPLMDMPELQHAVMRPLPTAPFKIGLLPGSRINEIKKILPVMLETAKLLQPDAEFILSVTNDVCEFEIDKLLQQYPDLPLSKTRNTYDVMRSADFLLIASGTASLEAACLQAPMVVIYKISFITSILARLFIKLKYLCVVNIIANKTVVPEFLQNDAKPEKIADYVTRILHDPTQYQHMLNQLQQVHQQLGTVGVNPRIAETIFSII